MQFEIKTTTTIWLIIWYRGGEEPFLHTHTNCQRNVMDNVNFTAQFMRVGSSVKSDRQFHSLEPEPLIM